MSDDRQERGLDGFLTELETEPGTVWRIDEPLSVHHEITAIQFGLDRAGRCPVLYVTNPVLEDGSTSSIPVVTNLLASRRVAASVLGVDNHRTAARDLAGRMGAPVEPFRVARNEAPVATREVRGEKVDLRKLPALVQHDLDPGPYLSAAHATTWDPDTGVDNTAIQRGWIHGTRELRFFPYPSSHNWANIQKWWARGEDAPVALWIGHHPALDIGANQKISYPESHWGRAGALLGAPVRLTPTALFGDDLLVPADAEFVLEGRVLRDTLRAEGPFGEYTGYLGPQRPSPVIEIDVVTSREAPIFHDYGSGLPDMLVPDNLLLEAVLWETTRPTVPSLSAIYVPSSGRRFHAYVQLNHPSAGEADEVIECVLRNRRIKHVVVVDEDVDVFDESQVLWAVATRVQWTRDTRVVTGAECSMLDPSLPPGASLSDKAGVDATLPVSSKPGLPRPAPAVSTVGSDLDPDALVRRIAGTQLQQFLSD